MEEEKLEGITERKDRMEQNSNNSKGHYEYLPMKAPYGHLCLESLGHLSPYWRNYYREHVASETNFQLKKTEKGNLILRKTWIND